MNTWQIVQVWCVLFTPHYWRTFGSQKSEMWGQNGNVNLAHLEKCATCPHLVGGIWPKKVSISTNFDIFHRLDRILSREWACKYSKKRWFWDIIWLLIWTRKKSFLSNYVVFFAENWARNVLDSFCSAISRQEHQTTVVRTPKLVFGGQNKY